MSAWGSRVEFGEDKTQGVTFHVEVIARILTQWPNGQQVQT